MARVATCEEVLTRRLVVMAAHDVHAPTLRQVLIFDHKIPFVALHTMQVRRGECTDVLRQSDCAPPVTPCSEWRHKQQAYAELMALDDRSLADIGIRRSEIPAIVEGYQRGLREAAGAPIPSPPSRRPRSPVAMPGFLGFRRSRLYEDNANDDGPPSRRAVFICATRGSTSRRSRCESRASGAASDRRREHPPPAGAAIPKGSRRRPVRRRATDRAPSASADGRGY